MPLGWVYNALQFWLVSLGISKTSIGLLSGVSVPWTVKFLWSPLIDRYALPRPGRRRSWIIISQVALAFAFGALAAFAWRLAAARSAGGFAITGQVTLLIGLFALAIAFLSATQDIALDAYAVELLHPDEQGPASGLRVMWYRIGMLVAGAAVVSASEVVPWPFLFGAVGLVFLIFIGVTLAAPEPERPASAPRSLSSAVWEPLHTFFQQRNAVLVALFLVFYKFGDNMGGTMVNPFLKDLCFSNAEAGAAVKIIGFFATVGGAGLGAALMSRMGLGRALWIFGFLQAGANLLYSAAALSRGGPLDIALCSTAAPLSAATRIWAYVSIAGEQGSQGMATSAMLALILRVCDKRYSATQYALLSSLFGLGRFLAGLPSGWFAERLGYPVFFAMAALAAIPGFVFLQLVAPIQQRDIAGHEEPAP
jgi:PAT family beta-lactamase induction signal transducer AmpG